MGASLRYLCVLLGQRLEEVFHFPFSTLAVNLTGCFLIGLANAFLEIREIGSPHLRLWLVMGVLGSFTTFSTFGHDAQLLLRGSAWIRASLYIFTQVVIGIALVFGGYRVARQLWGAHL